MEKRSQIECLYNRNLRLPKKERLSLRRLAALLGIARSTLPDEIRRRPPPDDVAWRIAEERPKACPHGRRAPSKTSTGPSAAGIPKARTAPKVPVRRIHLLEARLKYIHRESLGGPAAIAYPAAAGQSPPPRLSKPRISFRLQFTQVDCPTSRSGLVINLDKKESNKSDTGKGYANSRGPANCSRESP